MRILIVDDDSRIRNAVSELMQEEGHETILCGSGEEGLKQVRRDQFDMAILDVMLPGIDGLETLSKIRELAPHIDVLMMSGESSITMAVKATHLGARNFFEKPINPDQVLIEISHIEEEKRLKRQVASLQTLVDDSEMMIGESTVMTRLKETISRVAPSDSRVLILGENGTGKEMVARSIHRQSERHEHLFVSLNCAAIPRELVESELFGYEKGAFTGAVRAKPGRFEQADKGTLFLDEIGDMNLDVQAKLLRVLQENEAVRVGGEKSYRFDVRVLAATNKDLELEISEGRFREDLYYRLNVLPVHVAPLRERTGDIQRLAKHYLNWFSERSGKGKKVWGEGALEIMQQYDWPGNVRELRNFVERLHILCEGVEVPSQFVKDSLPASTANRTVPVVQKNIDERSLRERLASYENDILREAYNQTDGNVSEMARRLQIDRANLHRKLKQIGLK